MPKLVGSLTDADGAIRASVGIKTYPLSDPFAQVNGKNKAIRINSDAMGETIAIGGGADVRRLGGWALVVRTDGAGTEGQHQQARQEDFGTHCCVSSCRARAALRASLRST